MIGDSASAYVRMRRDSPSLDEPPISHQLHTYLIDGLFLNQKTYKDIRMSYSLKYKGIIKEVHPLPLTFTYPHIPPPTPTHTGPPPPTQNIFLPTSNHPK